MDKINIDVIDGHSILQNIAQHIGAKCKREGAISSLEFKNSYGKGHIYSVIVSDNFTAIIFDIKFNEEIIFRLNIKFKDTLNLLFCLEGHILHSIESIKKTNIINFRQNAILKGNGNNKIISFPAKESVKLSYIILSPDTHPSGNLMNIRAMANKLAGKIEFEKNYIHLGRYCARTAAHVRKMMSVGMDSFSDIIFKEAAILNIIASQIQRYHEDTNNKLANSPLRGYDLDKIIAIEKFINDNLSEKLTIDDLSSISGLSPVKLQRGFKFLHDTSVNNYITAKRLELATSLLEKDKYNVSEVVYNIGYTSRSYFSRIFKEKYGISPSEFVEQNRLSTLKNDVHRSI